MVAIPGAPKSRRRRSAYPRRAAAAGAPRPQVAAAERVGVAHLTAECWPFARTGGLGEAGSGLATVQGGPRPPPTSVMAPAQVGGGTQPAPGRSGGPPARTVGGAAARA